MEEAQPLLPRNVDEIIKQPANNAEENLSPPNDLSSTNSFKPEIDQPQSSDMEVHHHAHHGGKKNWKSYFWEFLMLFLAVFCGFLAEYMLEHKIERDRGKQYIISLYEDLKIDTSRIAEIIVIDDEKITALSIMYNCYDTILKNLKANTCLGTLIEYSRSNRSYQSTDRTLRQLANAGGYRLLSTEDADSSIAYDNMCKNFYDFQSSIYQQAQDNVRNTLNELVDFKANAKLLGIDPTGIESGKSNSFLFAENKMLLNKWFNELGVYMRVTQRHQSFLAQIKERAIAQLNYYKKEHGFK